jgi:hypothetical protein
VAGHLDRPFTGPLLHAAFNRAAAPMKRRSELRVNPLRVPFHTIALLLSVVLAGCGTNVKWLLAEQTRLEPKAHHLAEVAEGVGSGIEEPLYEAEDAKLEACRFMNDAAADRIQRTPSFGEQFLSELSMVVVLIVPVGTVERCAEALHAYRASIARLEAQLIELGVLARVPETGFDGSS